MGKPAKSSASSGTRKKHARKANPQDPPLQIEKKAKGKGKKTAKNEPKIKSYIPPPKYQALQRDPVDVLGLTSILPPELIVILRRFMKRDAVTRRRALEEFQTQWIDKCLPSGSRDEDQSERISILELALPVWTSHFPALSLNSSRRVRSLVASIQTTIMKIMPLRQKLWEYLDDNVDLEETGSLLGSWMLSSFDPDRQIAQSAKFGWNQAVESHFKVKDDPTAFLQHLQLFILRAVMSPLELYQTFYPVASSVDISKSYSQSGKKLSSLPATKPTTSKAGDTDDNAQTLEGEEESKDDREARIRISGLGSLRWLIGSYPSLTSNRANDEGDIISLLSSLEFWTVLYPFESPPFFQEEDESGTPTRALGYNQVGVRRAGWMTAQQVAVNVTTTDPTILKALSIAALRSAWIEPDSGVRTSMFEGLLLVLTKITGAWDYAISADKEEDEDEDGEPIGPSSDQHPIVYQEFLNFLRLGCGGSPVTGYQAIIVIISTLPLGLFPTTQESLNELYDAFWTAYDNNALDTPEKTAAPTNAYLSSLLECLVYLSRKSTERDNSSASGSTDISKANPMTNLVANQFQRLWSEFVKNCIKLSLKVLSSLLGTTLMKLKQIQDDLFIAAWEQISSQTHTAYSSQAGDEVPPPPSFFVELDGILSPGPVKNALWFLIEETFTNSLLEISRLGESPSRPYFDFLLATLEGLGIVLRSRPSLVELLESTFCQKLDSLYSRLTSSEFASLIIKYLKFLKESDKASVWSAILGFLGDPNERARKLDILEELVDASANKQLEGVSSRGELTLLLLALMEQVASRDASSDIVLLDKLLSQHEYFLSQNDLFTCTTILSDIVKDSIYQMLELEDYEIDGLTYSILSTLSRIFIDSPSCIDSILTQFSSVLFLVAQVYPLSKREDKYKRDDIQLLWKTIYSYSREQLIASVLPNLQEWVQGLNVPLSLESLLQASLALCNSDAKWVLANVLPSRDSIEKLFQQESGFDVDPTLAVLDILVPETEVESYPVRSFDRWGYSSYSRLAWALTLLASSDRFLVKDNLWILEHSLMLLQLSEQYKLAPNAKTVSFGRSFSHQQLEGITEKVRRVSTYIFSAIGIGEAWNKSIVEAIQSNSQSFIMGTLQHLIADLFQSYRRIDNTQCSLIIRTILNNVLRSATSSEIDLWLRFSRSIRKSSPNISRAIFISTVETKMETPLLERLRNEIASDLIGVPASRANEEGVRALYDLLSLAPFPEAETPFLPPQRAINVIQTIERWVSSDEDIDPVVESQAIELLNNLAPVIQSLPGGHWDFAFDLIENTLENSDITEDESVVLTARAISLVNTVMNLSSTNKQLRLSWHGRRTKILRLIRDLLLIRISPDIMSEPRRLCKSRALLVLQDIPEGIIEAESFPKMCHLLQDELLETQRVVYDLVRNAARKNTERLVIEIGLDTTGAMQPRLPTELLDLLDATSIFEMFDEDGDLKKQQSNQLAFLLGWLVCFDAFEETSLRVRAGFVEQLRNAELITRKLLPSICQFLSIGKPSIKPFKLDLWEVDTFYISIYEHFSIQCLAAHIYYRALQTIPSLIRDWWTDCKDKQLSATFSAYTSTYFSPVLIFAELSHLRGAGESGARESLEDESLSIKVSQAISEVGLVYTVDDQQMEMAVRMPPEYPLKVVEVRDIRRVGVKENKWRAWLFAVQHVVSIQNGHIADGLALFKKNVTLHFQGQVECAICYSIISVTDLALPTKPCKTCKNRFHSSCLYQWFKSSSSSSCPLCRSDIF